MADRMKLEANNRCIVDTEVSQTGSIRRDFDLVEARVMLSPRGAASRGTIAFLEHAVCALKWVGVD